MQIVHKMERIIRTFAVRTTHVHIDMNVITATEFRSNQRKYFDLAEREPVFVTRSGKTPIALTPVDLSSYPTEEEMKAIDEGLKAYERGEYTIIDTDNVWESIK